MPKFRDVGQVTRHILARGGSLITIRRPQADSTGVVDPNLPAQTFQVLGLLESDARLLLHGVDESGVAFALEADDEVVLTSGRPVEVLKPGPVQSADGTVIYHSAELEV